MSELENEIVMPDVSKRAHAIGVDVGTYTLQAARRKEGNIILRDELNGFLYLPANVQNQMMVTMVKASKAPIIEHQGDYYLIGQKALEVALAMDKPFRRPMSDGILSKDEKDAFQILAQMLRSIVQPVEANGTVVVYSSPAAPLNAPDRDPSYHQRILQTIFEKAEFSNAKYKVKAFPMNEARAIVMDQLFEEGLSGIGLSFGAGMVNASFCLYGVPIFEFSLVGSGDWIDQKSAEAIGESTTYINQAKLECDLTKEATNSVQRAIQFHYRMLLENVAKGLAAGVQQHKKRTQRPCPIVVAGGTASPQGFVELLRDEVSKQAWGDFQIGEIMLAPDHAHSVVRGLLKYAETLEV